MMTLKEILSEIKEIEISGGDPITYTKEKIIDLFKHQEYKLVTDLYSSPSIGFQKSLDMFEVAYSLSNRNETAKSKSMYERLLEKSPSHSSILNNLYVIESEEGNKKQAWKYIQKAYEVNPDDDIVARNYNKQLQEISEEEERKKAYQLAAERISNENDFVLDKLKTFFTNASKDEDFKEWKIPIAQWKFAQLIGTDKQRAASLAEQWIRKDYIRKTDERGEHRELIYELNPYILEKIKTVKSREIPAIWTLGLERLNASNLEELEYYLLIEKVNKIKKNFKAPIQRDINELIIAYIMQSWKTVIIMSGSILEFTLIYDQEKQRRSEIKYSRYGKVVSKKLYECDLGDLLAFYEENALLSRSLVHIGNISRIFRNFIHPGKELRDEEQLDKAKADLCYIGVKEIIKEIIR